MSKKLYQFLQCKPKLHDIQNFEFKVYSADGNALPFSGYVEVELQIPFLSMNTIYVPVLVTKGTEYNSQVLIIVGTNIIRLCKKYSNSADVITSIPNEWKLAFTNLSVNNDIPVKAINKYYITMGPF